MKYSVKALLNDGLLQLKRKCDDDVTYLLQRQKESIKDYKPRIAEAKEKQKAVNTLLRKRIGDEKFDDLRRDINY
jgi:hypothetical protein